jgi:hypothetical protein
MALCCEDASHQVNNEVSQRKGSRKGLVIGVGLCYSFGGGHKEVQVQLCWVGAVRA